MTLTLCGTGHRPDKLGGYSDAVFGRLVALATAALRRHRPDRVISGMALGWDQAIAQACVDLNLFWIAAVPFEGQESRWPTQSQQRYTELLTDASEVTIVCPGSYDANKMQTRNKWMVDRSQKVLALWNGTPGGTANCVKYADSRRVEVVNLWTSWEKYR